MRNIDLKINNPKFKNYFEQYYIFQILEGLHLRILM